MPTKQCPHCGSDNDAVSAVCHNCEHSFFRSRVTPTPEQFSPFRPQPSPIKWMLPAGIGAILILMFAAYAYFQRPTTNVKATVKPPASPSAPTKPRDQMTDAEAAQADREMAEAEYKSAYDSAPAIEVTALDLIDEYNANEITANEKYLGKKVTVSGYVWRVGDGMDASEGYITMKKDGDPSELAKEGVISLSCRFVAAERPKLKQIQKDSWVTMTGRVRGLFAALQLAINECELE